MEMEMMMTYDVECYRFVDADVVVATVPVPVGVIVVDEMETCKYPLQLDVVTMLWLTNMWNIF